MKFRVFAERLFKLKQLHAHEADDAYLQYDESVDSECSKHREKFATFNKCTVAFDQFLGKFLHKNQKYTSFWRVCGIIFILFHGQSTIERGLSINKQLSIENLQKNL